VKTQFKAGVWAVIAGLAAMVIGTLMINASTVPSDITCDHKIMTPGDECYSSSSSRSGTYEQRLARDEQDTATDQEFGPLVLVLGAVLAVGGTASLAHRQSVRAKASAIADANAAWWSGQGPVT